jgi:uroporphyrinogen-III synthase
MPEVPAIPSPLAGRSVALPESRQLDVLAAMFEKRGANVIRAPLVSILNNPNKAAVESWIQSFISNTPDYLIVLTGEGIRRLVGFATRAGCLEAFVESLSKVIKICRGPKPGQALKEIGLTADLLGRAPTTAGIIDTLEELDLAGKSVAVQLYGDDPNQLLMDFLATKEIEYSTVAPYIYADDIDTKRVLQLVQLLASGEVDIIAFTSKTQFKRLLNVATANGNDEALLAGLRHSMVAAVGPVVADQLQASGVTVDVCPDELFFMKPMLRKIEKWFAENRFQNH